MTFTDDDLKRLKEFVDAHGLRPAKIDNIDIEKDKLAIRRNVMRALLARLEAAEKIVEALDYMRDPEDNLPIHPGPELDELNENVEAWRQSKGEKGD